MAGPRATGGRGRRPTAEAPGRRLTATAPRPGTIRQGDRIKAFRPLPSTQRRAAFEAALTAYARGDFFEAHELLEPAWMGTDDLAERALHQGLIKLAAAYVHAVRGNAAGVGKNLAGARRHLAAAGSSAAGHDVDVGDLLEAIDARLLALAAGDPASALQPPVVHRVARG
jgi:predicted metal-dependent hydrolase